MTMPDCGFVDVDQFCKKGAGCYHLKPGKYYCKYLKQNRDEARLKTKDNTPSLKGEDDLFELNLTLQETNHLLERIATALEGRK